MKVSRVLPSKELLDRLLKYDPQTGEFCWRPRTVDTLPMMNEVERPWWSFKKRTRLVGPRGVGGPKGTRSPEWICTQWNSRWAGKPAASLKSDGYCYIHLNYRSELAHRIAYKIMTGRDPVEVDHIDGNRSNNKWANLRDGTRADNMRNIRLKSNNKSGAHGVHFSKRQQKWVTTANIGSFNSREEAIAARKEAEKLLGFHPNHGRN